jgi:hypothetical protein
MRHHASTSKQIPAASQPESKWIAQPTLGTPMPIAAPTASPMNALINKRRPAV